MSRQTAKYRAAIKLYRAFGGYDDPQHEKLYSLLEAKNFFWNADDQAWQPGKPQTSIFEGDGIPTGIFRLRVMGHPDEIEQPINLIRTMANKNGWIIEEISTPYPNRRGPGVRVYITLKAGSA